MKRCVIIFIIICTLPSFGACDTLFLNDEYKEGDWFYLENAGAVMPVWVQGNIASDVFVIWLHGGGAGGSGAMMSLASAFKELQEKYAFVYYDQRSMGQAQGNAKHESLTVEQYVEDLRKIIQLINFKYNNPTIFLMGGSWGGFLGSAFLVEPENHQYISGWINACGPYNWEINNALRQEWEGGNPYSYDPSKDLDISLWTMLTSPITFPFFYQLNNLNWQNNFDWGENFEAVNLTNELYKITVPTIVLWGRHDGVTPVPQAYSYYDGLGSSNKYLHIFEYSAHNIPTDEPELFVEKVTEFIEKYR